MKILLGLCAALLALAPAAARDDGRYADSPLGSAHWLADCKAKTWALQSENLWQCPTIVKSIENRSFWDTIFSGQVIEVPNLIIKFDLDAGHPIARLFPDGAPFTVVETIPFNVVYSLDRKASGISWAHIGKEVREGKPPLADSDATAAVPFVFFIFRIGASADHCRPNCNEWMSVLAGETEQSSSDKLSRPGISHWFTPVRDDSGKWKDNPLHLWFDHLRSGKGLCCSVADGKTIADVDWDMQGGHYRVRLDGQWIEVPDDAVIAEPNRYGAAVVWPIQDAGGKTQIRCFIAGALT